MRRLRSVIPMIAVAASACVGRPQGIASPNSPLAQLAHTIDSIADAPPMEHTTWGIEVFDQQSGRILYERNSNRHYIPASNTKLVVTTVAMGTLGPDYRYRTPILANAATGSGDVGGVVIVGSGDPTMSARFWGKPFAAAAAIADSIARSGVRRISGPLIIDASRFTDGMINGTWEVGDLPGGSAPPVAAFSMEESIFRVALGANEAGGGVTVTWPDWPSPLVQGQPINTQNVRADAGRTRASLQSDFLGRRDTIYFSGVVPVGRSDTASYSITDPPLYAGRAVLAALEARGIHAEGVVVARDSAAARAALAPLGELHTIATITSPPLSEIVSAILHPSQNWIAETLLKTLGAERAGSGSWRTGLAVEKGYLVQNVGLDSSDFNLRDASGMAAQNLLSPRAIVKILEHARTSPWGNLYVAGLAAPGEPGTLDTRLKEYQGRLRGKTGTISNVATLSGFITTDAGRPITFSIMTNGTGLGSATVRKSADEIVRTIARSRIN